MNNYTQGTISGNRARYQYLKGWKAITVIMQSGSGPNCPRVIIPAEQTADNISISLFEQMASPFVELGWSVLLLGKPGVDFGEISDSSTKYYDREMYMKFSWEEYVKNVEAGIAFARKDNPHVKIVLLGHSEGTQVMIDVADKFNDLQALLLIGFVGKSLKDTLYYQFVERMMIVINEIFPNGIVNKDWLQEKNIPVDYSRIDQEVSIIDLKRHLETSPMFEQVIKQAQQKEPYNCSVFDRPPIYEKLTKISAPIHFVTGSIDTQTPVTELLKAQHVCAPIKKNCCFHIVEGVGHALSVKHPEANSIYGGATLGPISLRALSVLSDVGRAIESGSNNQLL